MRTVIIRNHNGDRVRLGADFVQKRGGRVLIHAMTRGACLSERKFIECVRAFGEECVTASGVLLPECAEFRPERTSYRVVAGDYHLSDIAPSEGEAYRRLSAWADGHRWRMREHPSGLSIDPGTGDYEPADIVMTDPEGNVFGSGDGWTWREYAQTPDGEWHYVGDAQAEAVETAEAEGHTPGGVAYISPSQWRAMTPEGVAELPEWVELH